MSPPSDGAPALSAREWIAAFAAAIDIDPPSDETVATLLELAGAAAHASERIAAPIACYLVGVAGADPGAALTIVETMAVGDR